MMPSPWSHPASRCGANLRSLRSSARRALTVIVLLALIGSACGGDSSLTDVSSDTDESASESVESVDAATVETTPLATATPLVQPTPTPPATPTPIPSPTPDPGAQWEQAVLTAKDTTDFVPVYDGPAGREFDLTYEYLNGSAVAYPLLNPTYFGGDLALLVVEGKPSDDFVKVSLPIRPAGSTAWVRTSLFDWSTNRVHVEINVSTNTVTVWDGDELIITTDAVTGSSNRPTPQLTTYVDEKIRGLNSAYGPWMLSLAAFSESVNVFGANNGLPKLALHGTNAPQLMGQHASNGCIRVPNDIIEILNDKVPVGARVDIVS